MALRDDISPAGRYLIETLNMMNRVAMAQSMPTRAEVSPLRVVPPIRFEEEEKACAYCAYPIDGDGPWCSTECRDAYEAWEDARREE
jgi:hypothetical protein